MNLLVALVVNAEIDFAPCIRTRGRRSDGRSTAKSTSPSRTALLQQGSPQDEEDNSRTIDVFANIENWTQQQSAGTTVLNNLRGLRRDGRALRSHGPDSWARSCCESPSLSDDLRKRNTLFNNNASPPNANSKGRMVNLSSAGEENQKHNAAATSPE